MNFDQLTGGHYFQATGVKLSIDRGPEESKSGFWDRRAGDDSFQNRSTPDGRHAVVSWIAAGRQT